jgi:DNA invertase Pin-like site-specific DNA recombinase
VTRLIAAGVDERHIHADKASGARDDRPGLKACLACAEGRRHTGGVEARPARALAAFLSIITDFRTRGIAFRSLTEAMDTTTPHGELLFSMFGALAQYERALTRERVMAGPPRRNAGAAGRQAADDRRGEDRGDRRTRRRGQQGGGVPQLRRRPFDADRYAGKDRVDRPARA